MSKALNQRAASAALAHLTRGIDNAKGKARGWMADGAAQALQQWARASGYRKPSDKQAATFVAEWAKRGSAAHKGRTTKAPRGRRAGKGQYKAADLAAEINHGNLYTDRDMVAARKDLTLKIGQGKYSEAQAEKVFLRVVEAHIARGDGKLKITRQTGPLNKTPKSVRRAAARILGKEFTKEFRETAGRLDSLGAWHWFATTQGWQTEPAFKDLYDEKAGTSPRKKPRASASVRAPRGRRAGKTAAKRAVLGK